MKITTKIYNLTYKHFNIMKLKLLLLLLPLCVSAQSLKTEYFKTSEGSVTSGLFNDVKIPLKDGENKDLNVDFSFNSTEKQFKDVSLDKIEKMIDYSREYLLLDLKNKYSFQPRKVKISYSDRKNAWSVMWNYLAKNSYGGDVEATKIILYNNDLKRLDSFDIPNK